MAKRRKPNPMEAGELHGRCNWEGLRQQDRLLAQQPPALVHRQRVACRRWLAGEVTWEELLGER